jgi:hypothetical protein
VRCMYMLCGGFGDDLVLGVVRVCVHDRLRSNHIGPEGGAAIAGALRHVPSLTELKYVVGEGASHEAAGCVLGEGVMVGGLVRRCFLVGGCEVAASVW